MEMMRMSGLRCKRGEWHQQWRVNAMMMPCHLHDVAGLNALLAAVGPWSWRYHDFVSRVRYWRVFLKCVWSDICAVSWSSRPWLLCTPLVSSKARKKEELNAAVTTWTTARLRSVRLPSSWLVIESPVRSGYLMPRGPNQDPNRLGLWSKPKIT